MISPVKSRNLLARMVNSLAELEREGGLMTVPQEVWIVYDEAIELFDKETLRMKQKE